MLRSQWATATVIFAAILWLHSIYVALFQSERFLQRLERPLRFIWVLYPFCCSDFTKIFAHCQGKCSGNNVFLSASIFKNSVWEAPTVQQPWTDTFARDNEIKSHMGRKNQFIVIPIMLPYPTRSCVSINTGYHSFVQLTILCKNGLTSWSN